MDNDITPPISKRAGRKSHSEEKVSRSPSFVKTQKILVDPQRGSPTKISIRKNSVITEILNESLVEIPSP